MKENLTEIVHSRISKKEKSKLEKYAYLKKEKKSESIRFILNKFLSEDKK